MQPFQEDQALCRHLAALQPQPAPARRSPPKRKPKAPGIYRGTVVSIYAAGFAFLKGDGPVEGTGRDLDLFAPGRELDRGLVKGDRVTFSVHQSERKPGRIEARRVQRAA